VYVYRTIWSKKYLTFKVDQIPKALSTCGIPGSLIDTPGKGEKENHQTHLAGERRKREKKKNRRKERKERQIKRNTTSGAGLSRNRV